jgi:hypothetical protein
MSNCLGLLSGINPDCAALNKVGGVDKRVWFVEKKYLSVTYDNLGYMNSLALSNIGSIPAKLYKFTTKRDKNVANWPMTIGENVNTWNHGITLPLYLSTPAQVLAAENLANADDVVCFYEENAGSIRVLGIGKGLNGSAGEGGSGTLLNDPTGYSLTLSGEEMQMPKYFSINGATASTAQNIAYLDALSA